MIAQGYSMDLYCDAGPHGYEKDYVRLFGVDQTDCNKQAKELGWKISRDRTLCICPECIAKGRTYRKDGK